MISAPSSSVRNKSTHNDLPIFAAVHTNETGCGRVLTFSISISVMSRKYFCAPQSENLLSFNLSVYQSKDPGMLLAGFPSFGVVVAEGDSEVEAVSAPPRHARYSAHSFQTFNSSRYKSMTHGLQLLPQQSPAGGLTGFSSPVAAFSSAFSRIGASRDFSSRAKVGECFPASAAVLLPAIAPGL